MTGIRDRTNARGSRALLVLMIVYAIPRPRLTLEQRYWLFENVSIHRGPERTRADCDSRLRS
jgi:hypothetical protein